MTSFAVVGAGFGGVGAAALLRRAGFSDVTVFERGERIGGVWSDNTYPGAACDVPSHLYEFSFAPNPDWSRRYAPQAEIHAYLERVARSEGLVDRIRVGAEVTRATFDDERARWVLETNAGTHEADILIAACGQLSTPSVPAIPGLDHFNGPSFHSARWQHDVPLDDRRVAVIGSGCSAIQIVPAVQPTASHVDVYQRSPGWTLPKLDASYGRRARSAFRRMPILQRIDRAANFYFMETGALALTSRPWLRPALRAVGLRQITKAIKDPELLRKVIPTDEIGCKRIMLTDQWYPTLTRPNVSVITDRIEAVTPTGIRTADGRAHPADVLVLATGFKTHGFVAPMEVIGAGGRSLTQEWSELARAYLGLSVPGFPNMFLLYGPNTNGGTGSVIYTIEAGIQHVIEAARELERNRARTIEVRHDAAEAFDRELREALSKTVWHTGCTNWYVDRNGNDPNQWPWTSSTYRHRTVRLAPGAYQLA